MPSYYFYVRFSRRGSINAGHEWIWYIALWLDISGTDLNGGRWGSVSPPSPRRLHHHTRGNAGSAVKIVPLSPSSDNMVLSTCSPTALTSHRPSTALPSVSCFSSTSTVRKGFVSPSRKGTPVSKKNPIQKGVITQLLSALLSFPVMYGQIRRISHTGREQLEPLGRIFSRTLLPLLLACVHPCTKQAA